MTQEKNLLLRILKESLLLKTRRGLISENLYEDLITETLKESPFKEDPQDYQDP